MKSKSFNILIEILNIIIYILNKNDFKIYDEENTDYYISKIGYSGLLDEIFFKVKERKK
ncbi:hypothetical protein BJV85_002802 [Clostridium acetobutylicum]|uniref:Uncharacterized protein n=1 Tax=Clostridium acetobutylicum (strain ATCC 824 / DSM 792 / JCM 1419 / IAM 19013 / LMG 5710 / NBRC 13948 / NRRL B-527 / VKM B-1787 / 2291 / W) TaxID=272562 RepID=Q97JS7_CLOAB|nr:MULTISPECIES: hypothetical protein [Clostridium]AAK79168.1 Hypothetical protein CA_C1196 [Clostridium acetobutylicum ATCC 824]ADZ20246.1 Conserved hypothetical protein [Clostridium acetobutylicum EA 2018]AEI31702.1 hypothetical protein SMB_G1216 [Clostridium acetobutylicum DSM 1731]AWV81581.1 hypothetical protein DK921_16070 [Clostridium acetobutylicum]MBC2393220.1 hypothetical protein [Clostridium acetobutylicum]